MNCKHHENLHHSGLNYYASATAPEINAVGNTLILMLDPVQQNVIRITQCAFIRFKLVTAAVKRFKEITRVSHASLVPIWAIRKTSYFSSSNTITLCF